MAQSVMDFPLNSFSPFTFRMQQKQNKKKNQEILAHALL